MDTTDTLGLFALMAVSIALIWNIVTNQIKGLWQRVGKLENPKSNTPAEAVRSFSKASSEWVQMLEKLQLQEKVALLQKRVTGMQGLCDRKDLSITELKVRLGDAHQQTQEANHLAEHLDQEIKSLNETISKLNWDYANQVAGCKCHKVEETLFEAKYKEMPRTLVPLRGEWVAEEAVGRERIEEQYKSTDTEQETESLVTCGGCNGEGRTLIKLRGGAENVVIDCPECDGAGELPI